MEIEQCSEDAADRSRRSSRAAQDPGGNRCAFGRRCIPPSSVPRRFHTPGMCAPRALPGGRLDTQTRSHVFPPGS